jgi:hypothetical protein
MFVYKTAKEFEALTEYQQEKYLDEKRKHEEALNKDAADKSAKAAVDALKAELVKENSELIEKLNKENAEAAKEATEKQAKEYADKMEELEADMKRAKVGEIEHRMKGFSQHIVDRLSTDEGEKMIKEFFSGQRSKFQMQFGKDEQDKDFDPAIKAMAVPANGVAPEYTPIVGPGHDEFHARNIIPVFPTNSNLVRFLQYVIDPNAAGIGTVAAGATKPSTGYVGTAKDAPVRKIAGLLDVQDELMDDVVGFRAWIAYELPKAYLDAEDSQIYKGNSAGENLTGLWYQAGNQTFPQGSVTAASNTIDKVMAGITQVRKLKRNTSAVVLSPVAWQEIFINKGTEDMYTYPIVLDANGVLRIGGVPIYWSNVFNDGEGLVGDFARGTAIFQRKAMVIGYFEQNKDNVETNTVTIRIEGRIALPIFYPESFKKLLLTVTT